MKPEDRSREAMDHLTDRAAQIRAYPPEIQNREALVVVRCPRHALVLRVFGLRSGHLLALPVGQGWIAEIIRRRSGSEWWFPVPPDTWQNVMPGAVEAGTVMPVRCRCCAHLNRVTAKEINAAVRAGRRTITLRAVAVR